MRRRGGWEAEAEKFPSADISIIDPLVVNPTSIVLEPMERWVAMTAHAILAILLVSAIADHLGHP
jgi:hypothetical protein